MTRPARWWALSMIAFLAAGSPGGAQTEAPALTAEEAIRQALERDPAVMAAQSRLDAAAAGVRGARAPLNLQAELAPGVGFTNGNSVLSQPLDIGGRRSAQTRAATGLRSAAQAELDVTRLQVASAARTAYYDLLRARAIETAAAEAAGVTRQIRDAVRRRAEIGEAPAVQVTRAEIEVARSEQEVMRAQGEVRGRLAVLNLLLGRASDAPLMPSEGLTLPEAPAVPAGLVEQAQRQRPELVAARGRIEARRGDVAVARAQRRPELFAEVASDIWSLDRDPWNRRNLGFQARLSFPLFDRGRLRAGEERAQAGVREQEAEMAAVTRATSLEVQQAAAQLTAAREIARSYETTILPRTQELLRATRAGFDTGLTSFVEVLEAQRVARLTQTEYLTALFEATRARIALDRALGAVPGLAPVDGTGVLSDRSPQR